MTQYPDPSVAKAYLCAFVHSASRVLERCREDAQDAPFNSVDRYPLSVHDILPEGKRATHRFDPRARFSLPDMLRDPSAIPGMLVNTDTIRKLSKTDLSRVMGDQFPISKTWPTPTIEYFESMLFLESSLCAALADSRQPYVHLAAISQDLCGPTIPKKAFAHAVYPMISVPEMDERTLELVREWEAKNVLYYKIPLFSLTSRWKPASREKYRDLAPGLTRAS